MTIVVTGSAGFLGSRLVRRLAKRNYWVEAVDIVDKNSAWRLKDVLSNYADSKVRYSWCSAIDKRLSSDIKVIVHLGAIADVPFAIASPEYTWRMNTESTLGILEEMRRMAKDAPTLIYLSSESAVGECKELPIKDDVTLEPNTSYSASKGACELLVKAWSRSYGLKSIILRSSTMYGPQSRPEQMIPIFLGQALREEKLTVNGGNQTRDLNHVENVVDAIMLAIEQRDSIPSAEVFNIGSGVEISVREVAKRCLEVAHGSPHLDYDYLIDIKPPRAGEENSPRLWLDISKAKRVLGYSPKIGFDAGLRETADYIKASIAPEQIASVK